MLELTTLCQIWQLPPILSTWNPDSGSVHQTLLLATATGNYALRAYRYDAQDRWRIVCEHTLIAYVRAQGLPAIAPLPLSNGETILEYKGRYYALYPFATGQQVPRGTVAGLEIAAMGSFLGELHRALRNYSGEHVPTRSFNFDLSTTLSRIDGVENAIRSRLELTEEDIEALERLEQQRRWLMRAQSVSMTSLEQLEQQVLHGDYQETNLFFQDGRVSAIIDWDQTYCAPRAWEVVRTLHYTFALEARACHSFLTAYRCVMPLTQAELDVAAAAYGWFRAHDVWQYEELYLRDNPRIRNFMARGRFVPFVEQWAQLQDMLKED